MAGTITLLGPPGSGKGTQAARLQDKSGFEPLSPGRIRRDAREAGTGLGRRAAETMARGNLVPDELVIEAVRDALARREGEPVLLGGFPRTVFKAEALEGVLVDHDRELKAAVLIDVPDEEV